MKTPALVLALLSGLSALAGAEPLSLFDGKSLTGWEGDAKYWRAENGLITGGSLEQKMPHNDFLATEKSYHNFDLRLKIKVTGVPDTGMINSGIQIRSQRVPGSHEMSGYQVDAGDGWWGKLYDESRRNKVVGQSADAKAVDGAVKKDEWNEYRIRAEGGRIQSWINGVQALDYTEADANIAQDGRIGIQVHGGGKVMVQVKDITIEELPATPDAPTWEKIGMPKGKAKPSADAAPKSKGGRDISYNAMAAEALTATEQLKTFKAPPGFSVELVAAESDGIGKFIAVAWDHSGRMWSMTALDYPVDANEDRASAEALYAKGGRDKILVFDKPEAPGPHQPRVFAEKLALPLGILPTKDGVYAQYGNDIRLYRDKDSDGKADGHDVVLTGFGIQDSHLFPHQFTRGPGGWIYLAQGAFNRGDVKRPDGQPLATGSLFSTKPQPSTHFGFCKLARMRPDGSDFQLVSTGPNNIWGLVLDRTGEMFIQEANDIGYPVIPFLAGTNVPGIGNDKLKPYAPILPAPLAPPQMGGTGLSGLAIKEDEGWPKEFTDAANRRVFLLANPITNRIQSVEATPDNGGYAFKKLDDFITCTDPWFRPIAIQFGPDGCLYIVDWYNRIISHNEVPRAHPARDKTRGRIWRVRHSNQRRPQIPDLAKLPTEDLLLYLESPSTWAQRSAQQELVDRKTVDQAPTLHALSLDENKDSATRIHALWAFEELRAFDSDTVSKLLADSDRDIRREAARALASFLLDGKAMASLLAPLADDADPQVRANAIQSLSTVANPPRETIALLIQFSASPIGTPYDQEFQRYLVRAALEQHTETLAALLSGPEAAAFSADALLQASLALPEATALPYLIKAILNAKRAPSEEELVMLLKARDDPKAKSSEHLGLEESVALVLRQSPHRTVLETAIKVRNRVDGPRAAKLLRDVASAVAVEAKKHTDPLIVNFAAAYPLLELADAIGTAACDKQAAIELRVTALGLLGSEVKWYQDKIIAIARDATEPQKVRAAALSSVAIGDGTLPEDALASLWPGLNAAEREALLGSLTTHQRGARALLAAMGKTLQPSDLDAAVLERMRILLPDDAAMNALWNQASKNFMRVLRLNGDDGSYVDSNLTLSGPFTVECWVRLAEGIGNDDGILGNGKSLDANFFASRFRVWVGGGAHDIAVAKKAVEPGVWTHIAFCRDAQNQFRIYINGELDAVGKTADAQNFADCDVGRTNPKRGTAGEFAEYRVWDHCRTPEQIRSAFDRTFAGEKAPEGLKYYQSSMSDWPARSKTATVHPVLSGPRLLNATEAMALAVKLERFKSLASNGGKAEQGQVTFQSLCMSCHTLAGKGANLAPALDGSSHRDIDGLLRALLTPNAAVEGGYRAFRVETRGGQVAEGFLAGQNAEGITLRLMGGAEQRFAASDVKRAAFTERSLMIEGILESLPEQQVADLFAYIRTLK